MRVHGAQLKGVDLLETTYHLFVSLVSRAVEEHGSILSNLEVSPAQRPRAKGRPGLQDHSLEQP